MEAPACAMLPGSKSVLIVIFCRASKVTSVSKA